MVNKSCFTRRRLVLAGAGMVLGGAVGARVGLARSRELTIKRVVVQAARGQRLTPVAPNAYAPYRGYDVVEWVLRIQTAQGLEGICSVPPGVKPEALQGLMGLDPFALFRFGEGDRVVGPEARHQALLDQVGACDVALIDLLSRAMKRPAAELLGAPVRKSVPVYDSSVYMEDLLKPSEQVGLIYANSGSSKSPIDLVARKAEWVVGRRPEGFKALKMKIGRAKWMGSPQEALARDIEATNAVREAIGPGIRMMVDANRGYDSHSGMAFEYAIGVARSDVYFMEEMISEGNLRALSEFKARLRNAGIRSKLAAGESSRGGIVESAFRERLQARDSGEPLIDIEQADMNSNGFLYIRSKAAVQAGLGMTCAPHNFGSKLGLYAQIHLGLVTPNWEISETDDSEFPALLAEGVTVKNGAAGLTGIPGLGITLLEEKLDAPLLDLH